MDLVRYAYLLFDTYKFLIHCEFRRARLGTSSVQRIIFVWVIKEPQHLAWIASVLTSAVLSAPSSLEIDPRIHITGKSAQLPEQLKNLDYENSSTSESDSRKSSESEESKKIDPIPYSAFKTQEGRPDVQRIIYDAVTCASGPVSVDGKPLFLGILHGNMLTMSFVQSLGPLLSLKLYARL